MATNGEVRVDNFRVGMAVEVTYITPDSGRPTLDLKDDYDNIIIHVNARWDEGHFILNTRSGGGWGHEERPEGFDFSSGVPITVRIEASNDCLMILVNGRILHLYNHRVPVTNIKRAAFHWSSGHASKPARLISLGFFY